MVTFNQRTPRESASLLRSVFADMRKHNEHRRRVAEMLEADRERRLDQVIRARRKHRPGQAR